MIGNTPYKTLNLLNSNDITYTSFEKLMFKLKSFSGFYIALGVIGLIFLIILILFMIRLISTIKRIRNRKNVIHIFIIKKQVVLSQCLKLLVFNLFINSFISSGRSALKLKGSLGLWTIKI